MLLVNHPRLAMIARLARPAAERPSAGRTGSPMRGLRSPPSAAVVPGRTAGPPSSARVGNTFPASPPGRAGRSESGGATAHRTLDCRSGRGFARRRRTASAVFRLDRFRGSGARFSHAGRELEDELPWARVADGVGGIQPQAAINAVAVAASGRKPLHPRAEGAIQVLLQRDDTVDARLVLQHQLELVLLGRPDAKANDLP